MEVLRQEENELTYAVVKKKWNTVLSLCKTKPRLQNTFDRQGLTPLMNAVRYHKAPDDVVLAMLKLATKQTLDYRNKAGSSIIHHLALCGLKSSLRYLLTKSCDVNIQTNRGYTPLHCCLYAEQFTYDEHQEIATMLIRNGASTAILDNVKKTPLDLYQKNTCRNYDEKTKKENKAKLIRYLKELSAPAEIIARGVEAIHSYVDELKNGLTSMVNSRIMFLGREGAGKTSCVNALLGKRFNPDELSTDGIVTVTVYQTVDENGTNWEEKKVDVSKQTRTIHEDALAENIADKVLKRPTRSNKVDSESAHERPLLPSLSMDNQTEELQEDTSTRPSIETGGTMKIVKIKNNDRIQNNSKSQEQERPIPEQIHKKVVDKIVKKRRGSTVVRKHKELTTIWDCAGQLIYYITHRLFLNNGSTYTVTFSLLDDLDAIVIPRYSITGQFKLTHMQMIVFWIRSIYEYAVLPYCTGEQRYIDRKIAFPAICLVATHKDKLKGTQAEKNKKIKRMSTKIFKEIEDMPYEKHVDRKVYTVNNTNPRDKGIEELKKNTGGYMKTMARTVPLSWIDFQSKVQELGETRLHLSLEEVTVIGDKCGIHQTRLIGVLDYLNDTGIIFYSKNNAKLKNTVITNLTMMIGMLKKIITDETEKYPLLMTLWNRLKNEGILEEKLLRHLWEEEIKNDETSFEVFLEVMKVFGLVYEKESQEGNRIFLVPSRMKIMKESLEARKDEMQSISIYVYPKDFLPDAVYNVLVVSFLNFMEAKGRSTSRVELARNRSDFDLQNHIVRLGVVMLRSIHALKLEIVHKSKVDEKGTEIIVEPKPDVCKEILSYLKEQLRTVYGTMEGVGYELRVRCNACQLANPRPHLHKLDDCLTEDNVSCGDKLMTTARFKRILAEENAEEQSANLTDANRGTYMKSCKKWTDQKRRFLTLLLDLSRQYSGTHCDWLKFFLKDHLPIGLLAKNGDIAMDFFNELSKQGLISCTNVIILSEISKVTMLVDAESCINEYKKDVRCEEGTVLEPYRKALFSALRQVTDHEFQGLVSGYNLGYYENSFRNVWHFVFYLEKQRYLDDTPETREWFANLLNPTAQKMLEGVMGSANRPSTTAQPVTAIATEATAKSPITTTETEKRGVAEAEKRAAEAYEKAALAQAVATKRAEVAEKCEVVAAEAAKDATAAQILAERAAATAAEKAHLAEVAKMEAEKAKAEADAAAKEAETLVEASEKAAEEAAAVKQRL